MEVHASKLADLQVLKQIKSQKKDYSARQIIPYKFFNRYNPLNFTWNDLKSEKNSPTPQLFPGIPAGRMSRLRQEFKDYIQQNLTFRIELYKLDLDEFYLAQNVLNAHYMQSKFLMILRYRLGPEK
jgi:hypothetical protein